MKITTSGTQKESTTVEVVPAKKNPVLHYDLEYDSTNPEQTIRDFVSNIKAMMTKFESNKARIVEIENELLDIYHYIEISSFKSVPIGYKLYRKMAELRRERRSCKNENDLLQPIYSCFHATEVLNRLSNVQGECAKCKETIDARTYTVRTDVLNEWINTEEPIVKVMSDEGEPLNPEDIFPVDDPATLKSPGKTEKKPMTAFKQVWKAAL